MMNLWLGRGDFDNEVGDPDFYFSEFIDPKCIDTDFGRRVVKTCSDVKEVVNYATLVLPNEELISPMELSSGAKNLLIMMFDEEDAVCDLIWCGSNCESFLGEIASKRDFTVFTTRWFVPYKNSNFKDGVRILNTGKVVRSFDEYIDYVHESGLYELMR